MRYALALLLGLIVPASAQVGPFGAGPLPFYVTATAPTGIVVSDIGQNSNSSGATVTLTGVTVPAGSLIVVATLDSNTTVGTGTVTDTLNTYNVLTHGYPNNNDSNGVAEISYSYNVTALSNATITYTKIFGFGMASISAFYATGILTTDPKDTAVTNSATGSSTTPSVTSGTPGQSGELIVGVVFANSGSSKTFTQDSINAAWTAPPDQTVVHSTVMQIGGNIIKSGTGTSKYAPTISNTAVWSDSIVGFKHP
jgi:hypothetical protein